MFRLISAVTLPLGILFCFVANADELGAALLDVQWLTLQLVDRSEEPESLIDRDLAQSLLDKMNAFQAAAAKGIEENAVPLYIQTLKYDANLLRSLRGKSAEAIRLDLNNLIRDLDLKLAAGRNSLNASPILKGLVDVTVRTRARDHEVSGYLISLVPLALMNGDPLFFFGNPTSPTKQRFPPGRYTMIARDQKGTITRQIVELGLAAEETAEITVLVP
jgi:hypothetical protein